MHSACMHMYMHMYMHVCALCGYTPYTSLRTCRYAATHVISQAAAIAVNRTKGVNGHTLLAIFLVP